MHITLLSKIKIWVTNVFQNVKNFKLYKSIIFDFWKFYKIYFPNPLVFMSINNQWNGDLKYTFKFLQYPLLPLWGIWYFSLTCIHQALSSQTKSSVIWKQQNFPKLLSVLQCGCHPTQKNQLLSEMCDHILSKIGNFLIPWSDSFDLTMMWNGTQCPISGGKAVWAPTLRGKRMSRTVRTIGELNFSHTKKLWVVSWQVYSNPQTYVIHNLCEFTVI